MKQSFLKKSVGGKKEEKKNMGKRGQVTVFVLIGILIIVVAGGIYYTISLRDESIEPKEVEVPSQAEEVNLYVGQCVNDVLKDGIDLLGRQGGYIEFPEDPIGVGEFSNYLTMYGSNKVVYWYYKGDNNVDYIQKPSIEAMEQEVSNYVNNNLMKCLGVFNEYQGFTVRKGKTNTRADIQKDRVVIKVDFPLRISKGDFSFNFEEFYGIYNVGLGELYGVGEKIFEKQEDEYFFEKKTLDMMSVYGEIPYVGEVDSCVAPIWVKFNVINDFRRILRDNTAFYKVKGTNYELSRKEHEYYVMDANVKDANNVNVNFRFSEIWPLVVEIFPEENGLLKGKSVTENLGEARGIAEAFVCLSTFEFIYNVQYPILIILNKDGYTLQYATMVVIDKNEPRENSDDYFAVDNEYDQRFCQKQTEFSVDTIDDEFNALDSVEIKYKCITHLCNLGRSESGFWEGQVPLCINGEFLGEKEGYHFGKSQISTNEPGSALLVLEKLNDVNVDVLVERAGSGELREDEKVFISLEERNKEYNAFIVYPEQKSVKLIPGVYTAKVYMTSPVAGGLQVPEKTINNCVNVPSGVLGGLFGITEEKCEDVKLPGAKVDRIMTGTKEFTFLVREQDIGKKLVFYVPYYGVIKDITDISRLLEQDARQPRFE